MSFLVTIYKQKQKNSLRDQETFAGLENFFFKKLDVASLTTNNL